MLCCDVDVWIGESQFRHWRNNKGVFEPQTEQTLRRIQGFARPRSGEFDECVFGVDFSRERSECAKIEHKDGEVCGSASYDR